MKIDNSKIYGHCQLTERSCIPMAVECVLKLLDLMTISDFCLQLDDSNSGNSDWIHKGFSYPTDDQKVKFLREFLLSDIGLVDRGPHFMIDYFDNLFARIDEELANDKFVIISLESGPKQWHMEIIFEKVNNNEYRTLTFYHKQKGPKENSQNLKQRVTDMQGTDILTYKLIKQKAAHNNV